MSELEEELEQAKKNISLLQNEVRRLRAASASSPTTIDTTPVTPTEVEDPFASPDDFVSAIRWRYSHSFGELDTSDPRERAARLRALRGWSNDTRRELEGNFDWVVTLDTEEGSGVGRQSATFRSYNSLTDGPVGEPFRVRLNSTMLRDLRDAPEGATWQLTGAITPRIKTTPGRVTADDPGDGIFIGAYAELSLDIKVDSLTKN